MKMILFLRPVTLALVLAAGAGAAPAFGQAIQPQPGDPQPIMASPNPDADRLSDEMRVLAQNPRDLRALLSAAEISTKLDDTSAALAFYARAESVDPTNPRIFAGRAAALVRLERPGEAMRLFQQAEQRGLPMADYAADRGFAYDLLGNPTLAQRDYRTALARSRDDETVRRYALSLGIAGKPDEAMLALDPLLRRSDRAAWRARAFILAMNGDVAGAERISSSMMPGNMGLALTPFFRRLATLSVADRAFAVHFGELSPTQARRADATLAPLLPAYVPEPRVQIAAVVPAPVVTAPVRPQGRDRRSRRERENDELAATTSAALRTVPKVAEAPALPPPPQFRPPPQQVAVVQPLPTPTPTPVTRSTLASVPSTTPPPGRFGTRFPETPVRMASAAPARRVVTPAPAPMDDAGDEIAASTIAPTAQPPRPARIGQEDGAIAAIVSNITIPASELGVNPMPGEVRAEPVAAAPEPVRVETPPPVVTPKPAPKPAPKPKAETPKPGAKPGAKGATATADAGKGKKKAEPAKPKPPAEPARVWVQVAGGANETTLSTAWKKLLKQAPAAFRGKTPWTAPLRATNRVLTGPFKSASEAQAFVNTLKKEDISAFVFTSEAGQKITKLVVK